MANKYDVSTYMTEDTNIRCTARPGQGHTIIYTEEVLGEDGYLIREEIVRIKPDGCCELPWPNHVNVKWFTPYGPKGKLTNAEGAYEFKYVPVSKHIAASQSMKTYHDNKVDGTSTPKTPKVPQNFMEYLTKEEREEYKTYEDAIKSLKAVAAERKAKADNEAKAQAKKDRDDSKTIANTIVSMRAEGKSDEEILAAVTKLLNN